MCSGKFQNIFYDFCESEKNRFPNLIPVGIGIGIAIYFFLDNEPNFLLSSTSFILLLLLSVYAKTYRCFFCVLLTVSFGFFISQLRTKTVDTFMLSKKTDEFTSLVATVELCEKTEKGLTFIVDNVRSKKYKNLNKLHLTWRGKKAMKSKVDYVPGSKVLFRAILSPIKGQAFPGAYDFKKQQYFKKISARGFVVSQPKILKKPKRTSIKLFIEQLRHYLDKKIEQYLSADVAAVTKALITGNRSGISKKIRRNFSNSGTAHLLAISGLHMGIIGFFIFWVFRIFFCCFSRISMFYDVKKISAIISWVVVLFYLQISGGSVPSLRAFIMHTIIILAILLERCALTMRSVAIASTIIMTFSPEVILFPSFQMSFGAVIAIVAFYEHCWDFSKFFKTIFNIVATTLVASIPTAIFSMSIFNQLTLNSILANVVSVPLMSFFIMPIAVMALFFIMFDWAQPFIILMGYGAQLLIKISELSAQLPGSHFTMAAPSATNMAIFIFSGLILTLFHHKIRFLGIIGSIVGGIYYYLNPTPDVFISQNSKVIGVKIDDAACFNDLSHFRFIASAWVKSIGLEKRKRFSSDICKKCIKKIDDDTYLISSKDKNVIITDDKSYLKKYPDAIFLDKNDKFARIFYLHPRSCVSNRSKNRPWS
ncbi:MAG: ComEC family competence protein [Holosporaceae bacterium]|jgi:competence protein ComEC|nr:ComEC family competence protein [Holosporaceae bacterium]